MNALLNEELSSDKTEPLSGSGSVVWHWPAAKAVGLLNLSTQQGEWRLLPWGDVCMKQKHCNPQWPPWREGLPPSRESFSSTDSRVMTWPRGKSDMRPLNLSGVEQPLITLHDSVSSDYGSIHSSSRKNPLLHSWWSTPGCSLAISFYRSIPRLYLPKSVFLWAYCSRLALFRVQYCIQYTKWYLGALKESSHFQLSKSGRHWSCSLMHFPLMQKNRG